MSYDAINPPTWHL